jgi:gas vesicle protein
VREAPEMIQQQAQGNPLAAGLVAFGAGMLLATLFPPTEAEQRAASAVQERAEPLKDQALGAGREMKDHLQQSAQESAQQVKETAKGAAQEVKDQAQSSAEGVKEDAKSSAESIKQRRNPG